MYEWEIIHSGVKSYAQYIFSLRVNHISTAVAFESICRCVVRKLICRNQFDKEIFFILMHESVEFVISERDTNWCNPRANLRPLNCISVISDQ